MYPEHGKTEVMAGLLPRRPVAERAALDKTTLGREVFKSGVFGEHRQNTPGPAEHVRLNEQLAPSLEDPRNIRDHVLPGKIALPVPALPPGIGEMDEYTVEQTFPAKNARENIPDVVIQDHDISQRKLFAASRHDSRQFSAYLDGDEQDVGVLRRPLQEKPAFCRPDLQLGGPAGPQPLFERADLLPGDLPPTVRDIHYAKTPRIPENSRKG
jgi:hypothetical protein